MDPEKQIDAALDSALARYGQAEPRSGLEGRVLANLRAAGERVDAQRRWWPGLSTITAIMVAVMVVIGAAIFAGRERGSRMNLAIQRTPIVEQVSHLAPVAPVGVVHSFSSRKIRQASHAHQDSGPRLEHFPSPRPLSEQEQMLARYVEELPSEAKQIAQAQTELARRDRLEFEKQGQNPPVNLPQ